MILCTAELQTTDGRRQIANGRRLASDHDSICTDWLNHWEAISGQMPVFEKELGLGELVIADLIWRFFKARVDFFVGLLQWGHDPKVMDRMQKTKRKQHINSRFNGATTRRSWTESVYFPKYGVNFLFQWGHNPKVMDSVQGHRR